MLYLGKDENIIKVDNNTSYIYQLIKNVVHKSLEHSRGVGKPKEHYY